MFVFRVQELNLDETSIESKISISKSIDNLSFARKEMLLLGRIHRIFSLSFIFSIEECHLFLFDPRIERKRRDVSIKRVRHSSGSTDQNQALSHPLHSLAEVERGNWFRASKLLQNDQIISLCRFVWRLVVSYSWLERQPKGGATTKDHLTAVFTLIHINKFSRYDEERRGRWTNIIIQSEMNRKRQWLRSISERIGEPRTKMISAILFYLSPLCWIAIPRSRGRVRVCIHSKEKEKNKSRLQITADVD